LFHIKLHTVQDWNSYSSSWACLRYINCSQKTYHWKTLNTCNSILVLYFLCYKTVSGFEFLNSFVELYSLFIVPVHIGMNNNILFEVGQSNCQVGVKSWEDILQQLKTRHLVFTFQSPSLRKYKNPSSVLRAY
jgi:hypothetical protein